MSGGSTRTNPCGWGRFQGNGTGGRKCGGGGGAKGQVASPSDKGVKMFEMANSPSSPPTSRRGGQGISGSFAIGGRPWDRGVCSQLRGRGSGPRRGRRSWGLGASTRRRPNVGCMPVRLAPQAQAQNPPPARSRGTPAAAPPQPPGRLHQGRGGNPPHPQHARHGMLRAF